MTQKVISVEEFYVSGMLGSWALVGGIPSIKPEFVTQRFYEYEQGDMKFLMRISEPSRNTHSCNGSVTVSERGRLLWGMQFRGACRSDAVPILQFFHRTALEKKRFLFGHNQTRYTEGDYRYVCRPKQGSDFRSFEGSEMIHFHGDEVIHFKYSGRFYGAEIVRAHQALLATA